MAKLTQVLGLQLGNLDIILVGVPQITNIMDSDDKPYYVAKTKSPIMVRCSVDPDIEAQEVEELYLRESAVASEDWVFVDEKKPEEGYFMKDWVADFSKGQKIPIYQETSIKKWAQGNRSTKKLTDRDAINASIREKMEQRKKQQAGG